MRSLRGVTLLARLSRLLGLAALAGLIPCCGGGGAGGAPPAPPITPPPAVPPPPSTLRNAGYPLGVNLEGLRDWTRSIVYTNVFKLSRAWSVRNGTVEDQGRLHTDPDGWVTSLDPGDWVSSIMMTGSDGNYPTGRYVCLYDGDGGVDSDAFTVQGEGSIVPGSRTPGRFEIEIQPASQLTNFVITKINPANHIRNIRVILPGFERTYSTTDVFHPRFLTLLEAFHVLRFMDWGETNNSTVVTWADRTPGASCRHTTNAGAPIEAMIALCNRTRSDMWFCVPHQADDDYVTRATTLIRDTLDADLRLHLEYSNEVWNFGFQQAHWAQAQGALRWPDDTGAAFVRFYGYRAAQVMDLASAVFADEVKGRLVRVMGVQGGWPYLGTLAMDTEITGPGDLAHMHVDVIAVAPYFGFVAGQSFSEADVERMTVDQVLDICESSSAANNGPGQLTEENFNNAAARGLGLVAYEGGQSLTSVGSALDNPAIVDLLIAANRHPRMRQIYLDDMNRWTARGGTMYAQFSHMSAYGKYGCWGLLERQDQDLSAAYKWQGVQDWLAGVIR